MSKTNLSTKTCFPERCRGRVNGSAYTEVVGKCYWFDPMIGLLGIRSRCCGQRMQKLQEVKPIKCSECDNTWVLRANPYSGCTICNRRDYIDGDSDTHLNFY